MFGHEDRYLVFHSVRETVSDSLLNAHARLLEDLQGGAEIIEELERLSLVQLCGDAHTVASCGHPNDPACS